MYSLLLFILHILATLAITCSDMFVPHPSLVGYLSLFFVLSGWLFVSVFFMHLIMHLSLLSLSYSDCVYLPISLCLSLSHSDSHVSLSYSYCVYLLLCLPTYLSVCLSLSLSLYHSDLHVSLSYIYCLPLTVSACLSLSACLSICFSHSDSHVPTFFMHLSHFTLESFRFLNFEAMALNTRPVCTDQGSVETFV